MAEQAQVESRPNRTRGADDPDRPAPRRRPKNRKAQIATVAAEAFSERGYHGVSVDEIASAVGISGPALYRHFPNKYALFLHAVTALTEALQAAVAKPEPGSDATGLPPEAELDRQLLATIRTSIENRRTGGLYRWDRRYLTREDRAATGSMITGINLRIGETIARVRPGLAGADYVLLSNAVLSVIGSITAHRAPLASRRLEQLLLGACHAVVGTELPPDEPQAHDPARARGLAVANRREVLLHEAVLLFDAHGYHEVSIEQIGTAAGINASGVYRHFASKSDLLAAAFHRAGDRLAVAVGSALAESTTPLEGIDALTEVYVRLAFEQNELMSVYFAEIGNLPASHRTDLRNVQRLNVDEWARLVSELRPGLTAVECRFLVHAALNLVLDTGRLVRFDPVPSNQRRVRQLMRAVLLGNETQRDGHTGRTRTVKEQG
ncbi:MAG: TetR/AcrR family transcriptional regulator [Rhodococcus sp. (in: high G+C Gram-positive bacteria)]|uniref:TetR/AcrR family transcriptional regulator n=1 Tax=Rhodococcus sp. TaxID=1831 RepID=UPI003BB61038